MLTEASVLTDAARDFYAHVMVVLKEEGIPFLVGGAYASEKYTGISRHTKDFDLFIKAGDLEAALRSMENAGYQTEQSFPHWLAKVFYDEYAIDLIYSSGNGVAPVDDLWFVRSHPMEVFGIPVQLCPPEEIIYSKAFIMERERFDGADVAHLILKTGTRMDWTHLLARFGDYWPVLFGHVVLFQFIYPCEKQVIPRFIVDDLIQRFVASQSVDVGEDRICYGTLLSRAQYLVDLQHWGFADARLYPPGLMTHDDIQHWTKAIGDINKPFDSSKMVDE